MIAVNDIVQIDPDHDERFGACLLVVTDVKSWGVQGYVKIPNAGDAYYRVAFDKCARVGSVEWAYQSDATADPLPTDPTP